MKGRLIAVVGPSGAGKDTLIRGALLRDPSLCWARRAITRPASGTEPFESLSEAEFDAGLRANRFALHWHAHGLRYAVAHAQLQPMEAGVTVLLNGSRAALPEVWARFPALRVIEVTAPPDVLRTRLAARGRESAEQIAARVARDPAPLPEGLPVAQVLNDGPVETGVSRFLAALQPVRV